ARRHAARRRALLPRERDAAAGGVRRPSQGPELEGRRPAAHRSRAGGAGDREAEGGRSAAEGALPDGRSRARPPAAPVEDPGGPANPQGAGRVIRDSLVANESEIRELRQALERAERRIHALKRVAKTRKLRYQRAEAELARLTGTWPRRAYRRSRRA